MRFNFKKFLSDLTNTFGHIKRNFSNLTFNLIHVSIKVKLAIVLIGCAIFTPIRLETKSQFINNLLETAARDVIFLSQVPAIRIFSSINFSNEKKAIETRMLDQFSKISSTEVFIDFLKTNLLYQQLTYLDINGMERLQINQQQENIILINDDLLVDRSDKTYFNDTMALSEHKVYISDVELNDLNGTDKNSNYPVIRLATQVFDKQNQLQGILVINVSGQVFHNSIQDSIARNGSTFIIDQEGYYLAHSDTNKSWSKLKENKYTLEGDFPHFNDVIERISNDNLQHVLIQGNEVFFSPITLEFNQTKKWYFVEIIPSTLFIDSTRFYLFIVLFISIFGIKPDKRTDYND
jgi:hypothetical protein